MIIAVKNLRKFHLMQKSLIKTVKIIIFVVKNVIGISEKYITKETSYIILAKKNE